MKDKKIINNFYYFFALIAFLSYLAGFFFNENSIGSGGYKGDLVWIWKNFNIFKNNTLFDSINHKDFFGSRTPLLYIINIYLNPFINDIESYRFSIFIFSLLGPLFFYIALRQNYPNIEKKIILLLSSIILISPYYRTSAYWGMEINYGIIAFLISVYYLKKIENSKSKIDIFFLILFSSLSLYFDQKLLIIALISYIKILVSKNKNEIFFSTFIYFIFSIPYIYLIITWGGLTPKATQIANQLTVTNFSRINSLNYYNLGYACTICAFYLFPFALIKKNNSFDVLKSFFNKKNLFLASIVFVYLFFLEINYNFEYYTIETYEWGLGIVYKLSILLFKNIFFQKIFTFICIIVSWILILFILDKNKKDFFILSYFLILSLFLWPMTQEYFDPILTTSFLLLFKTSNHIDFSKITFLFLYMFVFLLIAFFYYT